MIKPLRKKIQIFTSPARKTPEFLIVGAQKAGTSSLYNFLKLHPQVQMPRVKEIHYFDNNYSKGLDFYKSYFPLKINKRITGEASPYYLFHPLVPQKVFNSFPAMKIIVILRSPVSRAISHYKHNVRLGIEKRSLLECFDFNKEYELIKNEEIKIKNGAIDYSFIHQHYSYLSRGFYSAQLNNWMNCFNPNNILLINFDKLVEKPSNETGRMFNFLGISSILNHEFPKKNQSTSNNENHMFKKYEHLFYEDLKLLEEKYCFKF